MKTIEEEKKQAFDNAAITLAIGCMPIDESILPFELGFYAGVEFAERWIPVEEELPENDDLLLVKNADNKIATAMFDDERFYVDYGAISPNRITHWRPINHK